MTSGERIVGKHELLAWARELSGLPCSRLEDLKSGVVIVSVMLSIFPRLSERRFRVHRSPRFAHVRRPRTCTPCVASTCRRCTSNA